MSTPDAGNPMTRKERATAFLHMVVSGYIHAAYEQHTGPGFRHHNPYFKGDATSLMRGMEENELKFPGKMFEVQRALEEGDLVAVHSRLRLKPDEPGLAVVHIFRFQEDRIVELWDMAQPVPQDIVNENGMF